MKLEKAQLIQSALFLATAAGSPFNFYYFQDKGTIPKPFPKKNRKFGKETAFLPLYNLDRGR